MMNDHLSWYESGLPSRERKMRGHFSTPPLLVEQILDACGYTSEQNLSRIRVLDPACGSGNFLAGAARRLVAFAKRANLPYEALAASVQCNIWGFDPDPVACFLAEMQLRMVLQDVGVQCIASTAIDEGVGAMHWTPTLHIHQADGLTLPWEQCESVDLFLANPPYLAAKNSDLSGYRSAQGRGQVDSYLLFLSLALQVVRPNGWIGLVLPDPVLARANAAKERQRLLEETTLHHLWHLSGVFPAHVGAVVIIAQKSPPKKMHHVSWVREKWHRIISPNATTTLVHGRGAPCGYPQGAGYPAPCGHPVSEIKTVSQSCLLDQPRAELRYLLGDVQGSLIERLHMYLNKQSLSHERFAPLGEFVFIRRGEELGKECPLLTEMSPSDIQGWYPVLRGGIDVRPYATSTGRCWIAREAVTKPLEHYLTPKLLVVKSTGHLQAALDTQGHIVLQTLYILNLRPDNPASRRGGAIHCDHLEELYFLLALLNSRLLREYVHVLHTAYKWVQPQIEQHVLASLPIPIVEPAEKAQIIERAKLLMHACGEVSSVVELEEQRKEVYEELERAICALYNSALSGSSVDKGVRTYG